MQFLPGETGHIEVRKSEQKQESGLKLQEEDDGTITVRKITELFKRRNTGLQVGDHILKLNGKDAKEYPNLNAMKVLIKREVLITIVFRRPFPEEKEAKKEVVEPEEVEEEEEEPEDDDSGSEQHAIVPYEEESLSSSDDGAIVPFEEDEESAAPQSIVPYDDDQRNNRTKKKGKSNSNAQKGGAALVPYDDNVAPKKNKKNNKNQSKIVPHVAAAADDDDVPTSPVSHGPLVTAIEPGQMMKLKKLKGKAEFNGSFVKVLRHAGKTKTSNRWEVEVMSCPDAIFTVNENKLEMP